MKIYQVFESYPLFYQPYIPPVLKELTKIKGLESKIIAYKGDSSKENEAFIFPNYYIRKIYETFNQKFYKKYNYLNFLEIKAQKENVDIIHVQHSFLFSKVLGLLKINNHKRPKIIITLRGGDTYVKPWISKRWKDFYSDFGNKVDAFIVMSEDQKQYLSRWNVPLENIHVIPISFGKKFKIEPKYPNKNELKLVSVFRMCWEKNIADNLRLVKQLKEFGIKVQYDVYGDGKDLGQLYYLKDRFDLAKEVRIKGKINNEELKAKLSDYDFLLQLSHSESLGMSVIEAQTRGLLVIISDSDGLPEVVIDNQTGFILKKENYDSKLNEIIATWRNDEKYHLMSRNAINFTQEKFSIENEVNSLVKLYSKLVK
jgi:glycosyltransferase involved in cell wall biosynthesis